MRDIEAISVAHRFLQSPIIRLHFLVFISPKNRSHVYTKSRIHELAVTLIERGADINAVDKERRTLPFLLNIISLIILYSDMQMVVPGGATQPAPLALVYLVANCPQCRI